MLVHDLPEFPVLLLPVPVSGEVGLCSALQFSCARWWKTSPTLNFHSFHLQGVVYKKCVYVIYREKFSLFSAQVSLFGGVFTCWNKHFLPVSITSQIVILTSHLPSIILYYLVIKRVLPSEISPIPQLACHLIQTSLWDPLSSICSTAQFREPWGWRNSKEHHCSVSRSRVWLPGMPWHCQTTKVAKHPSMAFMNKWIAVNQAHLKRSHYHLVTQRCCFRQGGANQLLEPLAFLLIFSSVFFSYTL